jgi:hypothetical protein
METIKVALEYMACYSTAFVLGVIVGAAIGFYVRGQWNELYNEE